MRLGGGWALAGVVAVTGPVARAHAQLIVGNDGPNPSVWHIDLTGFTPPRALYTGTNASLSGLAADLNNMRLFWTVGGQTLVRAEFRPGGTFTATPTVTVVGPILV